MSGTGTTVSVYEGLRASILNGDSPPGMKLRPSEIKKDFQCAASTVREVLVRLACEGLVTSRDQRGFAVRVMTPDDVRDITHMRTLVEREGARLAIRNGDLDWEARLTAAHHKLAHIEEQMTVEPDKYATLWRRCDQEFHEVLLSVCGNELLRWTHRILFDQFRLVVVMELQNFGFRGKEVISEHKRILDHALARDADACYTALSDHLGVYASRMDIQPLIDRP